MRLSVILIIPAVLCFHAASAERNSPSDHRMLQKQRQTLPWNGREGYYELNPNYEHKKRQRTILTPPGGANSNNNNNNNAPLMMHQFNIDQSVQMQPPYQNYFSPTTMTAPTSTSEYFSSIITSARAYVLQLYRTSPDLFYVSATSLAVFVLWRLPMFQRLLQTNFICNQRNIKSGKFYVLASAAVSHISFYHILMNLVTFLSIGPTVKQALATTRWPLWPLMLGAAVTGNIAHLLLGHRDGCLGLSGVTLSFMAVLARLYPNRILGLRLMGIFPVRMPAHILLRILLVWSLLGSFRKNTSIAHMTHLGGLLFGISYFELWKRRSWQKSTVTAFV